jgi:hypothetical protein
LVEECDTKGKNKNKKCLYGFERRKVYHELIKAWQYYYNLSKEEMLDKKKESHYKRIINNLQDKLRKPITQFSLFEVFGLYFYKLNPELFKEGIANDSVEKVIIKTIGILESGMRLDLRPNMVEEIIRSDYAMQGYVKGVSTGGT